MSGKKDLLTTQALAEENLVFIKNSVQMYDVDR